MTEIYGESGGGKSFFAIDFGACVATGKAWHGKEVTQGKVLYMAAEGRRGLQRRQMAWEQANDLRTGKQMLLSADAADLSNEEVIEKLQRDIRSIPESENIKLVIVDTLASHNLGDENSTQDMSRFIYNLGKIQREFKLAIMLVHHVGQAQANKQRSRGSSAIRAALDTEILIEKNPDGTVTLRNTKQKDFEEFSSMTFQLNQIHLKNDQGQELADNYGRPVTSCVLEQIGYVEPETPKVVLGKNQKVFIRCFEELLKESPEEDRVNTAVLKEMVRTELDVQNFSPVWRDLKKSLDPKFFSIGDDVTIRK
jgi:KaiC/GvpD/RAD55 family RecA-like ATPase